MNSSGMYILWCMFLQMCVLWQMYVLADVRSPTSTCPCWYTFSDWQVHVLTLTSTCPCRLWTMNTYVKYILWQAHVLPICVLWKAHVLADVLTLTSPCPCRCAFSDKQMTWLMCVFWQDHVLADCEQWTLLACTFCDKRMCLLWQGHVLADVHTLTSPCYCRLWTMNTSELLNSLVFLNFLNIFLHHDGQ